MFDNNIHYIMKELDSIYNVVVENLGKELLNKEIKHLEYEPKMDRININNLDDPLGNEKFLNQVNEKRRKKIGWKA